MCKSLTNLQLFCPPKPFFIICFVCSVLLWVSCDCSLFWISEPAGLQSFLKVELKLRRGCIKNEEPKPSPLLCSVLQALAIQGDLQHKMILFSKSQKQDCVQQGCSLIIYSLFWSAFFVFFMICSLFFIIGFVSACFRSSAAKVHAEATGDPPFAVCDLDGAAGWKRGAGSAVFGEEQWGKVHAIAGLQEATPGAQDAACTPSRYSVAQSGWRTLFQASDCWDSRWRLDNGSNIFLFFLSLRRVYWGEEAFIHPGGTDLGRNFTVHHQRVSSPQHPWQQQPAGGVQRCMSQTAIFFVLGFCFFIPQLTPFLIGQIFLCSRWSVRPRNLRPLWRTWSSCREIPPTCSNTPETSTVISPPRSAKM